MWATKYRYGILQGDIQHRCRDLLIQICNSKNVHILKGVVSKDYIHIHIESPLIEYKYFDKEAERSFISASATGISQVE